MGRHEMRVPLPDRPIMLFMRDQFDTLLLHNCGAEVRDGCAARQAV